MKEAAFGDIRQIENQVEATLDEKKDIEGASGVWKDRGACEYPAYRKRGVLASGSQFCAGELE